MIATITGIDIDILYIVVYTLLTILPAYLIPGRQMVLCDYKGTSKRLY